VRQTLAADAQGGPCRQDRGAAAQRLEPARWTNASAMVLPAPRNRSGHAMGLDPRLQQRRVHAPGQAAGPAVARPDPLCVETRPT